MTRRSLMRECAGASNFVQTVLLVGVLALGVLAGVRLLEQAVDTRMRCAGEDIRTLANRAGPCRESAKGDSASNGPPASQQQARAAAGGCGGGGERPPGPEDRQPERRTYDTQPTLDQIQADPFIQAELERAWNESNPDAPEVPAGQPGSQKREQGGWIVWNRETGQLEVIRGPAGDREGLPTTPRPPDNDQQRVVASFHTHPNTAAEGYDPDPSPDDIDFTHDFSHVPEIIETHDGRRIIPFP